MPYVSSPPHLTHAHGPSRPVYPQLLWDNLVAKGLPVTALGFDRPNSNAVTRPPRRLNEASANGWLLFRCGGGKKRSRGAISCAGSRVR